MSDYTVISGELYDRITGVRVGYIDAFGKEVLSGGGGGGTPGGSDTQPQYNNAGAFGGMAGITWVPGTSTYTFGGGVVVNFAGATSGNAQLKAPAIAGAAVITLPNTTGTLALLGVNTFTGSQSVPAGSPGAASIRFGGDTSGFYSVATGTVSFSAAGTAVVLLSAGTGAATWTKSLRLASTTLLSWSAGNPDNVSDDNGIGRRGPGSLFFGIGDSATPVAYTLAGNSCRGGTDNNAGGGDVTFSSGAGTGIGPQSSLRLKSPALAASGSTQQAYVTGLVITQGVAVRTNYTVAGLPTPSAVLEGAMAWVTDATTTHALGVGTTVVGGGANKVPVSCDGTNWKIG